MRRFSLTVIAGVALALLPLAHARNSEPVEAKVDALAFIAGSWEGELFGGRGQEHWIAPQGGAMVGSFILTWPDNDRRIYELLLIEQEGEHVTMCFRHFSPGMELWEAEIDAPLRFVLIESEPKRAVFQSPDYAQQPSRFIFEVNDDRSVLSVTVQSTDSEWNIKDGFEVAYQRVHN